MGVFKSKIFLLGAMFLTVAILAAPMALAKKPKQVFKVGTLAPRGIGWAKAWEEILVPSLSKATNGELGFKVYYGGIMGDDEDYIKKMRFGQLQAASITGQGAILACPDMLVLELPFLLRDYDEVDYIRPRMYPVFDELAQKRGFKLIYWFEQDFDQIYSLSLPLNKLADYPKAKFLTWYGPVEERVLETLGAEPIPVNGPEVPAALRQGVVNSLIAPAVWVVGSQTYTVIKYVNPIKIRYAPGLHIWSMEAWNRLSEKYRQPVIQTRETSLPEFIQVTRQANETALQALKKYGMNFVEVSPQERKAMEEKTRPVWDELAGKEYSRAVLDQLMGYLEQYRAQKGAAGN